MTLGHPGLAAGVPRLFLALVWLALAVAPAGAQPTPRIRLASDRLTVAAGQAVSVDVLVENAVNLGSFQFNLLYDPDLVEVRAVQLGDFLAQTGRQPTPLGPRTDRPGDTAFGAFTLGGPDQRGPDGGGRLATVQLVGKRAGVADLRLDRVQATDPQGRPIPLAETTPAPTAPGSPAPAAPTASPGRAPALTATGPAAPTPAPAPPLAAPSTWPLFLAAGAAALAVALAALAWRRR